MTEPTVTVETIEAPAPKPEGSLADLVRTLAVEAMSEERVQERIRQRVNKAIDDAIDSAFSWGDTQKTIRKAVDDSLRVHDCDLPSYGQAVGTMVSRSIQARVSETIAARLETDIAKMLKLAPKELKLSELVADLWEEQLDPHCACPGETREIHCKVEWHDWGSATVFLDEKPRHNNYDCEFRFWVSLDKLSEETKPADDDDDDDEAVLPTVADVFDDDEKPQPTRTGKITGGSVKGVDFAGDKNGVTFGRWYGLGQRILAAYACDTTIILDVDDIETEKDWDE